MVTELSLLRLFDSGDDTIGILRDATDRTLLGFTCEDQRQLKKVARETRIPAKRYQLVINPVLTELTKKYRQRYPWFEFHIMLKDVPGFTGIYIHVGNDDEHTDGCVLVGDVMNNISLAKFDKQSILESTACYERFYKKYYPLLKANKPVFITIIDESF